jgi:peroxiredoxin
MYSLDSRPRFALKAFLAAGLCLSAGALLLSCPVFLRAQTKQVALTDQEKRIENQLRGLRDMPDDLRAHTTKQLAIEIRQLPASPNKLMLANGLASLSTEGDFGRDTLQEVAATLAAALREHPVPAEKDEPPEAYVELAQLVRYEHVQVSLDDPQFASAMSQLESDDERRQQADFTLTELGGNTWALKALRGKVVLVNFWATWCSPCRKEMPDLQALYNQFKDQGLVILGISDEDASKVRPFVSAQKITYPILLDPGRKVNDLFRMDSIPKTFIYDRSGKLVSQSIDMRTRRQFLEMLAQAGLH